jgi:hypothetical protein
MLRLSFECYNTAYPLLPMSCLDYCEATLNALLLLRQTCHFLTLLLVKVYAFYLAFSRAFH